VESEEDDSEDKMEETDDVEIIETPVSTQQPALKKAKRKVLTSGAVYVAVTGRVRHKN
jgi:hypothetical protein